MSAPASCWHYPPLDKAKNNQGKRRLISSVRILPRVRGWRSDAPLLSKLMGDYAATVYRRLYPQR